MKEKGKLKMKQMKLVLPAVSIGCIFVACFTTVNPIIILSAAVGPIAFFLGYSYDKQEKVLEQLLKKLEKSESSHSDDNL